MQSNEGMPPKSVADLDIDKWVLRYQRNRNIVPAGLPRFFLGHVVALKAKVEELEFRLDQRTEALAQQRNKNANTAAERKPANGNKKLKKDEDKA